MPEVIAAKCRSLLTRLWLEYGWPDWHQSRFRSCGPALLQPLIDKMSDSDPNYNPEKMIVFAYDPFGALFIRLGDYRGLRLNRIRSYAHTTPYPNRTECFNLPVCFSHPTENLTDRNISLRDHPHPEEIFQVLTVKIFCLLLLSTREN